MKNMKLTKHYTSLFYGNTNTDKISHIYYVITDSTLLVHGQKNF